jgi:hypothetical protein
MTGSDVATHSIPEAGSPIVRRAGVAACGFCRRRLSDEFFFSCRRCDASFCFIHMSRHQATTCARLAKKDPDGAGVAVVHIRAGP